MLALQLTRQARLAALRALDRVDVDLNPADIEDMIRMTADLLSRLEEVAAEILGSNA